MIGITLRAGSEAGLFWEWVDRAGAHEASSSIRALGYPPHLTLARYVEASPDRLREAVMLFAKEAALSLTFDRIGIFDVDPLVLWLAPRRDPRLLDLHERIHAAIGPASCDPHYRPRQWTPHLTIAAAVPVGRRQDALALAAQPFTPFGLVFDALESVSWPPVRVLASTPLRPPVAEEPR